MMYTLIQHRAHRDIYVQNYVNMSLYQCICSHLAFLLLYVNQNACIYICVNENLYIMPVINNIS